MVELSHAAKTRLVTYLAQFSGPSEAARLVSEEFAVTLDRRTAWKYDATKRGCKIGPAYRQLFRFVRRRWLQDLSTLPIAHRGHRLRVLDRLAGKLEAEGNYAGALRAVELAAKEANDVYSKRGSERGQKAVATVATGCFDVASAREELAGRMKRWLSEERPL